VGSERVRIAEVVRGTLVRDVIADGRVTAANSPTLYAVAAGTVELKVLAGDTVARDQPMAAIASPELQSRLAQEQATLAGLEAEVGRAGLDVEQGRANAQKLVDQAEIDRQTAARELERSQQAYQFGALPEIDVLRAQDGLKKAEIALAHARKDSRLQGRGLGFDLSTKRQSLDRQREVVRELSRQVESLVIRSPVDGQVGQVLVAQRANVAANAPLVTVVDLSAFELEIKVPDSFARDLAIGMPAEISAGGAKYTGRVRSVSPEVVNGEVASRLEFVGDKPAGLRQNQRLTARILLDEKPDVLIVERGPFLEAGGGNIAYVVRDGVAERRSIRTGAASLDAVEILSGAQAGDRIVVSGTDSFDDAERIRIAGE
jgi:HlyD family secretion protein